MRRASGIQGVLVALLTPVGFLSAQTLGRDLAAGLVAAAVERASHRVTYDGSYRRIPYPSGDVPAEVGVCTDVVIRSYRALGVDLQQEVHEDMEAAFQEAPPKPFLPGGIAREAPDALGQEQRTEDFLGLRGARSKQPEALERPR